MSEDQREPVRFGVVPTYRCNMRCDMCNRGIDKFPWQPSDLTAADVKEAGEMVIAAGIRVNKVRITGGEPTLHPELREICDITRDVWQVERCTTVLTNGTTKQTRPWGIWARYKGGDGTGPKEHFPTTISPADMGLSDRYGTEWVCDQQKGCGRLFDAFGFSFCVLAGALGRMLGIDPYSRTPVLKGDERICKHCIFSLSRKVRWRIWQAWRDGKQEPVTRTYQEAEDAYRLLPFRFKLWKERD